MKRLILSSTSGDKLFSTPLVFSYNLPPNGCVTMSQWKADNLPLVNESTILTF